tara:strand:- start:102 stop:356 length:255 start_codon:yes stop_codon:yes gene_type:complete
MIMSKKYFVIEITNWSHGKGYTIAKEKMFDNLQDASEILVALSKLQSLNSGGCDKTYQIQEVSHMVLNDEPLILTKDMEVVENV